MKTNVKGEIAKQKIIIRAIEKGWLVSIPTFDCRYDLILDDGNRLYRVQAKYANGTPGHSTGAVVAKFASWYTNERGKIKGRTYTAKEIEAIVVYVPKTDQVLWFPPEKFQDKKAIIIRIEEAKNKQNKLCNMADDFLW